jgi:hypothetical protein
MHVYKRYDSEKRRLSGPLLFFNLEEEFIQLKEYPEWSARHRNAVTLLKVPHLSVVLMGLQKGAALSKHKAQGPVTICVLIGAVRPRVLDVEDRRLPMAGWPQAPRRHRIVGVLCDSGRRRDRADFAAFLHCRLLRESQI